MMTQSQIVDDDEDETFLRQLVQSEEDRLRLHPTSPWIGGYRWFRSPNVIPIEKYRQRPPRC
jgi:hypothetical protein